MFSDLSVQKDGSSLLCRPASEDQEPVFERLPLSYTPCSQRYRIGERSFTRQYAHIYAARLMQMRPLLTERALHKWGKLITFLPTYGAVKHLQDISVYYSSLSFSVPVRIRCAYQEAV